MRRKKKGSVARVNEQQTEKAAPEKEAAQQNVTKPTPPVKRLWLVLSPALGWRAFIEPHEASRFAVVAGVPAFPYRVDRGDVEPGARLRHRVARLHELLRHEAGTSLQR
jgi:hypothetical protein